MSNNTVIPGISGNSPMPNAGPGMGFGQPNFQGTPNGTVVPGVNNSFSPASPIAPKGQVFGFLFSVSRTMAGEYWPLYLGSNTLGRGQQNSIQLSEATVSDTHANIHIISRGGELIVYITDTQSKTGTLLNGDLLRGEADLKNGDIITIGEHYILYVVLINAVAIGLKQDDGFMPVDSKPAPFPTPGGMNSPYTPQTAQPFHPSPVQPKGGFGTVVEGQSGPIPVGGHTVIMDPNIRK